MDQFAERLGRLAELSPEDLSALEQEMTAAFDDADSSGDVDTMSQLADAIDTVRAESQRRTSPEEGTADAAPADDAAQPVAASAAEGDTAVLDPPTAEVNEPITDPEAPAAEDTTPTPEDAASGEVTDPVAAPEAPAAEDTTTPQEENQMDEVLTASDVDPEAQPDPEQLTPTVTAPVSVIRAGGDIPGVPAGSELKDSDDLAEAMTHRINSLRNMTGGSGEQVIVASLQAQGIEDDRILRVGDVVGNEAKLRKALDPEALTAAANGWCAPRVPIYNVYGLGDANRDVLQSLTSFQAERGGVLFTTPPKLADAGFGSGTWVYDTGSSSWKASSDVATAIGAATTKVLYDATCPAEVTSDLEALTVQLRFTNMMARAFPELVKRNMELADIAHARFAESRLLRAMWAATTSKVTVDASINVGACRDILFGLDIQGTALRNIHRMADEEHLDVWAPLWLRHAMALDLMYQAPGENKIDAALSEVDGYVASKNLDVTWYRDTVPGYATSQLMTGGTAPAFPATAAIIIAPKGSYLHLDGGNMDIGVVRDSSLVGTNQYIEFHETFEQVAFVGIEALGWSPPVKIQGQTGLPITTVAGVAMS